MPPWQSEDDDADEEFLGIACKLVQRTYGDYKNVRCRFVGVVIPGQTLRVEMWKASGNWVVFQVRVVETGKLAIAAAGVELVDGARTEKAML